MTDRSRPERGFDASLSRSLRAASGGGGPEACPDPNILAAYAERALPADESAAWEAHLADCARCQAQLASLARVGDDAGMEPDAVTHPSEAPSAWPWDWRWMAPLATAAVVLVAVWVIEPGSERDAPAASTEARLGQRQAAPARISADEESAQLREQDQPAALASPAAAPPTDLQRRNEAASSAAERRLSESVADQLEASDETVLVPTPNPAVRWRLGQSGRVERTADAGGSWEARAVAQGLEPLAGSAPSDSVFWIVGRAGAIFRTVDGQSWERLTAPEDADLIAVDAIDASTAVVTTVGGTSYATGDGGLTWTRR